MATFLARLCVVFTENLPALCREALKAAFSHQQQQQLCTSFKAVAAASANNSRSLFMAWASFAFLAAHSFVHFTYLCDSRICEFMYAHTSSGAIINWGISKILKFNCRKQ